MAEATEQAGSERYDRSALTLQMQDPAFAAAPQPFFREMRDAGPVVYVGGAAMPVSRDAVDEALKHPDLFTSEGVVMLGNIRPLIPLGVDPPKHVKYRKLLDPLFAPKRMDAIEADITQRFNDLVDVFVDKGTCEFHDMVAVPYPSSIFVGLMGLPESEVDTLLALKDGILRSTKHLPPGSPIELIMETMAASQEHTGQEIYRYFDEALDERETTPREDILTLFLRHEVDGDRLTREEILDICFLFLIAGLDTVTDSLSCMWAFLAQHPDHRDQIVADPGLVPNAVEELLRWESPVPGVSRRATRDTELAGVAIKAGDAVRISLGSANTDEAEMDDAYVVRFDREVNRHIAFGGGVHRCLGSHLARRELRVAVREWHRRIPSYSIVAGTELRYPLGLRSVENLWLEW